MMTLRVVREPSPGFPMRIPWPFCWQSWPVFWYCQSLPRWSYCNPLGLSV